MIMKYFIAPYGLYSYVNASKPSESSKIQISNSYFILQFEIIILGAFAQFLLHITGFASILINPFKPQSIEQGI